MFDNSMIASYRQAIIQFNSILYFNNNNAFIIIIILY
jgi:hypothetical protein